MKKVPPNASANATPGPVKPAERIDPLEWIDAAGAASDVARAIDRQLRNRRRRRVRAAAIGGTCVLLSAFLWPGLRQGEPDADRPSSTAVTVHRPDRQRLPDGSVVELRAGARVASAFTPALRKVEVFEGEAHFQVEKDPARPFVVSVGGVEVRAVGTAFSVELGRTSVEVLVTEGRVAVRHSAPAGPSLSPAEPAVAPPVVVDAGNVASVALDSATPSPVVSPLPAVTLKARLAWRVPQLQFSGTPLAEVVAQINTHGTTRVTLGDAALDKIEVSGVLRADNLDTLLELLAETHGIKAEKRGASDVVLTRAR